MTAASAVAEVCVRMSPQTISRGVAEARSARAARPAGINSIPSHAAAAAGGNQQRRQQSLAAAEVEHAAAGRDPARVQIAPKAGSPPSLPRAK